MPKISQSKASKTAKKPKREYELKVPRLGYTTAQIKACQRIIKDMDVPQYIRHEVLILMARSLARSGW